MENTYPTKVRYYIKELSFKSVAVLPGFNFLIGDGGSDSAGDNKHYW
jgi:hypothetical protein